MEINLKDKVVVITGAAGGLGSAIAKGFARDGAKVVCLDLKNTDKLKSEIISFGGTCYAREFDITDPLAVEENFKAIKREVGYIDVLINNAGINVGADERKTVENFSDKWWDAILAVDLKGVYNCTKHALKSFNPIGGSIINISSIVGITPLRNQCAFAVAKSGVINLTKAAAIELAEKNVRVNCIAPGTVGIELTNKLWQNDEKMKGLLAHIPMGRQATPEDIVGAAMFFASDLAKYITGAVLPVDGGWTAGGFARNF